MKIYTLNLLLLNRKNDLKLKLYTDEIEDDFPSKRYEVDEFDVDTSEWYGDEEYYENEIDKEIDKRINETE